MEKVEYKIYRLYTINLDGKIYVGLTSKNVEERKRHHIFRCFSSNEKERAACPKFYNKIRSLYKDSKEAIKNIEIIEIANSKNLEDAKDLENFLTMEQYCSVESGLNTIPGGIYNPSRGKPLTEEHKRKISESNKGKVVSEETKQLISEAKTGKKLSEEHKKNLSLSHIGLPGANKGKPLEQNVKDKISKSLTGKTIPLEVRQKMSDSHAKGSGHHNSKLTESKVIEIKKMIRESKKLKDIAVIFKIDASTISDIKREKTWRHIK
jgi:hypothetical protein